jgi:NAD(P)-dependent dehydrogenase (short-subunit alcohol dehydrogenase family)
VRSPGAAHPIRGSVVVITGAASGIGRATATAFADEGARLVLTGRSQRALDELLEERPGQDAIAIAADVADEAAVQRVAAAAIERFGRIDTWVNNAGVMAYGEFERIPAEVFRQTIETNLFGQVHGARAALRAFRRQDAGTLINISSLWGRVTSPLVSPYVVSKSAARALGECLSQELVDEPHIHVSTILPAAVDTPIFDNSANYTGRRLRPIWPIFDARDIAAGILACARSPKREITYGRAGKALEVLYTVFPPLYRRLAPGMFMRGTFVDEQVPSSPGTVFEPGRAHRISGDWRRRRRRQLALGLVAALAGGLAGLAGRARWAKP